MLSAFTARPIIELRQRDKSRIETILAYGTKLDARGASVECAHAETDLVL